MRAVSFLDKVEYEFDGNFLQDAICLGDADNDKGIELVAANLQGHLAVFKYRQSRPWATASNLGAVASVVVGEITNDSQNKIVSISCDGWCNIFALQSDATEEERKPMAPLHSQRLPANTKMALLADINGDGKVELILGLTDRVVRTYQWTCFSENGSEGKLVGLQKWEFANQVGTISLSANQAGGLALLVAQPGGTYTKLDFGSSTQDSGEAAQVCPQHHKLDSSHMRNPNVSSAILGGVRGTRDGRLTDSLMALATLDGTLMLVDGDNILWSLQVDHQLSALTKLDIVGDGRDEVIACAWDGQTYIVDEDRQSVRFQFDEAVCTFTAGRLTLSPGVTLPCLVYATFGNRIVAYYNVTFPNMATQALLEEPQLRARLEEGLPEGVDPRKLVHWCLYGSHAVLGGRSPGERNEDRLC